MDDRHLNQIVKNQLEDFEASPPEEAWDNIRRGLKRERKIVFHERLSGLIVMLSLAIAIWLLVIPLSFHNNNIADKTEKSIEDIDRSNTGTDQRAGQFNQSEKNRQLPPGVNRITDSLRVSELGSQPVDRYGHSEQNQRDQLSRGQGAIDFVHEETDRPDIGRTDLDTARGQMAKKFNQSGKNKLMTPGVDRITGLLQPGEPGSLPADLYGQLEQNQLDQLSPSQHAVEVVGENNMSGGHKGYLPGTLVAKISMRNADIWMIMYDHKKPVTGGFRDRSDHIPFFEDEKVIDKRIRKFELFAMAIPSLFYHNLETNKSDDLIVGELEERAAISGERIGYKTALGGAFRYRDNLELSVGLIYAWANESFNFTERTITGYHTVPSDTKDAAFKTSPEFTENSRSVTFNRKELGLQLGAALLLSKGKTLDQSIGGSIAFHKNLVGDAKTDFMTENIGLRNYFSYLSVFYKMDYRLSHRFDLTFQPTFSYASFINENESSPLYIKPNNISLNFGIAYHL